jgi:hypothetical protein
MLGVQKKNAACLPITAFMQRSIGLGIAIGAGLWFHASRTRMESLLLFGSGLLWALKAGVRTCRKLVLKFLDPPRSVDEFQFSCVKRVADIADVDLQFFTRATCLETVTTSAGNLRFEVLGMNAVFHGFCSIS